MNTRSTFVSLILLFCLGAVAAACGSSEVDSTSSAASDAAETNQESATEEETVADDAADEEGEAEEPVADDSSDDQSAGEDLQVEINLVDELDGILNGYCLDIAGGNESVDPANGLQAHTCYSYDGDLGEDQVFATANFTSNTLYMPIYDVCAEVSSIEAGATIGLNTCDGSDLQSVVFADGGTITPASDSSLCFTAGSESSTGRSGDHQIRELTLETCSDDLASLQQWTFRTGL